MSNEVDVIIDEDFILNEWVPALRSGKYVQGKNRLRTLNNTYCCLGVAADLLNDEAWGGIVGLGYRWKLTEDETSPLFTANCASFLPSTLLSQSIQDILGGLNDNSDATFEDIATVLEQSVVDYKINLVIPTQLDINMFRELVREYRINVLEAR